MREDAGERCLQIYFALNYTVHLQTITRICQALQGKNGAAGTKDRPRTRSGRSPPRTWDRSCGDDRTPGNHRCHTGCAAAYSDSIVVISLDGCACLARLPPRFFVDSTSASMTWTRL